MATSSIISVLESSRQTVVNECLLGRLGNLLPEWEVRKAGRTAVFSRQLGTVVPVHVSVFVVLFVC